MHCIHRKQLCFQQASKTVSAERRDAHSRTMSPLDSACKPGYSHYRAQRIRDFVTIALYKFTFPIPYRTMKAVQKRVQSCQASNRKGLTTKGTQPVMWYSQTVLTRWW